MHTALQALSEPHRMAILSMLADGERPAGDFVDALPIAQPTVSKHLSVLREAGLVTVRKDAQRRLEFTPARKDGVAVPSETYLSLVIATEPVGDGKFALKLRRAVNGPGVARLGKLDVPKYQGRRSGAMIVVSVDVDAEGKPVMASKPAK